MIDKIKSQSGIHHKMLQLALVEKASSFDQEFAKEILDQIKFPDENSINNRTTARRVSALIWTWRSKLYETGKIPAMAEAIHMWNRVLSTSSQQFNRKITPNVVDKYSVFLTEHQRQRSKWFVLLLGPCMSGAMS